MFDHVSHMKYLCSANIPLFVMFIRRCAARLELHNILRLGEGTSSRSTGHQNTIEVDKSEILSRCSRDGFIDWKLRSDERHPELGISSVEHVNVSTAWYMSEGLDPNIL